MRSIYKYILYLYVILYSHHLYAYQETFRSLSVSDGMTDLVVNTIYKDARGFVWFGTDSSVERFDGIRLKKYSFGADVNKNNRVYDLKNTPPHGILCASETGIYRLDESVGAFVPLYHDKINFKVNSILPLSADTLFAATDKGLFICTREDVRQILFDGNVFSGTNKVTGLSFSSGQSLWLSTMDGIVCLNYRTNEHKIYKSTGAGLSNAFYNICAIGDMIFLGTMNRGIVRFDVLANRFDSYIDVGCSVISSLSCDGKDMLYVGTDGNGVHFISVSGNRIVKSYRHVPGTNGGIRSNSVYSLLVDGDGLLWVGLYQMGVDYTLYQSGLFDLYRWKDKFTSKDIPVRTITFNGKQRLIGSRDGLIFIDEEKDIVRRYMFPELRASMIISSCFYEGKFYVGTYGGGMYVLDPVTLALDDFAHDMREPFHTGHIFCIRTDREGNMWVGTSNGLYCFKGGRQIYHFTSSQSKLPSGNVYEVFFDSSGNGWICAEKGMCIWEHSTCSLIDDAFPPGFVNHEKVRAIYETSNHLLLFLPEKGFMFRSDIPMKDFSYIDNVPMLDRKQLLSVIEDGTGGILVATNNGMYRLDTEGDVMPFNFTDGIPSPIFINCTSVRDAEGNLWFGNSKGLVVLRSGEVNRLRKRPYKVEITNILANGSSSGVRFGKSADGEYQLHIDEAKRNLTVQFSGLIYSDPSNMIYEYSTGGKDEWKALHGVSEISLYEVIDNSIIKIRMLGHPESQVTLRVDVEKDMSVLLYSALVLVLLGIALYLLREWLVKYIVGNLKKFIVWLQRGEKKEDDDVAAGSGNDFDMPEVMVDAMDEGNAVDADSQMDNADDKYKNYKLSDEECRRLIKILDREMSKNKLYMNPSLKIADLAVVANTSSHALSYVFNQFLQKSYYDYINEYRVEEFKTAIQKEKYSRYTLEALSEHCGFSSRASFFRSFKKVTGITPNEYIKNIKMSGKDRK